MQMITSTLIPKKIFSRKEEITRDFLKLVDQQIDDLMNGRGTHRPSATSFGKLLFIHPRHLTNTIKLMTGKSVCDIMEERILKEAQELLKNTDLSVADIADKFAYREPTNFIKFFKGMAGLTPLQYRKTIG